MRKACESLKKESALSALAWSTSFDHQHPSISKPRTPSRSLSSIAVTSNSKLLNPNPTTTAGSSGSKSTTRVYKGLGVTPPAAYLAQVAARAHKLNLTSSSIKSSKEGKQSSSRHSAVPFSKSRTVVGGALSAVTGSDHGSGSGSSSKRGGKGSPYSRSVSLSKPAVSVVSPVVSPVTPTVHCGDGSTTTLRRSVVDTGSKGVDSPFKAPRFMNQTVAGRRLSRSS